MNIEYNKRIDCDGWRNGKNVENIFIFWVFENKLKPMVRITPHYIEDDLYQYNDSSIYSSIYSFTTDRELQIEHPQKYYYSSGMNHPTAYKNI